VRKIWVAVFAALLVVATSLGVQRVAASQTHAVSGAIKGCTGKGTVNYMYWGDSGDDAAHKASIKLAEKSCKGLKVVPNWDSGNYDTDLATKVGSGNAPDLFQLDASKRIPEYVSLGALAPMDSFIKAQKLNMKGVYWPQCVNELTYKKHVYGLPRTCSNQSLLFYNKEMFKARGVKFPTNNWTYANFVSAASKLSGTYSLPHDSTSQLRFGIALNTDDFRVEQFMWDWGGDWLNSARIKCTLISKYFRAGLQYLHDIAYKHHGMPILV